MTTTKVELRRLIKSKLGYPMIKIELTDQQIDDNIAYARNRFIKLAIGNTTTEQYMTILLSGGQSVYDLPSDVKEVIDYQDGAGGGSFGGGINTLFTIENYFYSQGMMANLQEPFNLIGYHIALDFIETLNRYVHSSYQWDYNRFSNQLTLTPTPPTSAEGGSILNTTTSAGSAVSYDSPGYALLKVYKLQADDEDIYGETSVEDLTFALCMRTLGFIRRKFGSFASVGNQGLSLDGDSLISEANEMIDKIEERIKMEDNFMGYGLIMG